MRRRSHPGRTRPVRACWHTLGHLHTACICAPRYATAAAVLGCSLCPESWTLCPQPAAATPPTSSAAQSAMEGAAAAYHEVENCSNGVKLALLYSSNKTTLCILTAFLHLERVFLRVFTRRRSWRPTRAVSSIRCCRTSRRTWRSTTSRSTPAGRCAGLLGPLRKVEPRALGCIPESASESYHLHSAHSIQRRTLGFLQSCLAKAADPAPGCGEAHITKLTTMVVCSTSPPSRPCQRNSSSHFACLPPADHAPGNNEGHHGADRRGGGHPRRLRGARPPGPRGRAQALPPHPGALPPCVCVSVQWFVNKLTNTQLCGTRRTFC